MNAKTNDNHRTRTRSIMTGILQDLRYALRQLRKSPGFTAIAVITLALAIGATTAIFSLAHVVLLAPLPYREPDRLMMIWGRNLPRGEEQFPISAGDFSDWKQKNDIFEDIAGSYDHPVTLTGVGEPKLVLGYAFTANYFRILGTAPRIGRTFTDEEAQTSANVVVLSDRVWRTTFHADPQIVGRAITLDEKPYTVIGIMPPGFDWPTQTEMWLPTYISAADSGDYEPEHEYLRVLGRLKPGVSVEEAQARMNALERQIAAQHPQTDAGNETWVEPLRHELAGDIRTPLLALLFAVGLVLFIACVNVAGLLLARAASRRAEVSLRAAIGASRLRLVQQFLIESLLLSLIGGALGLLLALGCTRFLVAIFPNNIANLSIPHIESIPINAAVLLFAFAITLLTALVFGGIPAMALARRSSSDVLKEAGRGHSSGIESTRLRRMLVSAEVALSFVLMIGAGLMLESFQRVYHEDLGFRPDHLLGLEVFLPHHRYPDTDPQKRAGFVNDVLDGLKRLPGVEQVAVTNYLPLTGFWGIRDFLVEGQPPRSEADKPQADNRLVTPGYFSAMGIGLLRGRDFTEFDRPGSEQVAIVNSTLARRYFGGEDPIGKFLQIDNAGHVERWHIVGVVSDVRAFGPEEEAHAELYRPLAQISFPLLAFVVRTSGDPGALLNAAKQAVRSVDKDQPIWDAMPVSALAAQSVTLRRVSTILLASFATLALILAAVGLYGVMAYAVVQRTQEIGIRLALGAQQDAVLRLILSNGIRLVLAGEIVGLVTALALIRAAKGLLYGVGSSDPTAFVIAFGLLTLVAIAASYIPARRAAKVDPMVALRYE
jgi:predicted permease